MSSLKRVDFTEIYKAITGLPFDDFELKDKLLTAVDNCAYDNGYSTEGTMTLEETQKLMGEIGHLESENSGLDY